uniref:Putative malate dehydrogenase n=1 Tax=Culex tarsalis TaxID=7177 RepID=A0A1Q3EYA8_CULTA
MTSVGAILLDWIDRDAMCRVCLCPNPVAKWNLFDCTIVGRPIAEVLAEVAGVPIQRGDNYPTVCCSDCLKQVEAAGKLREQCHESNRRMAQIFDSVLAVVIKPDAPPADVEEEEEENVKEEPMEEDSFADSVEPVVEAPLAIAAVHGMPEEPAPPVVPAEGSTSSQNSTVISNFKVDGLEIRIEVPDLQSILQQSATPSLVEPLPQSSKELPAASPPAKYECCGCPCKFDTEEAFDEHVRDFHEPKRVPLERVRKGFFECFRCYRLVKNLKIHHTRGNYCQICCLLFKNCKDLNQHYNSKHKIIRTVVPSLSYECCGCTQNFSTEKAFQMHVELVHKPQRPPKEALKPGYKECFRCYKPVKNLKEHHIRDRYCKICREQFSNDFTASIHYRSRHAVRKITQDEVKICCGCAAQFPTIGALKLHSNQVHYQHKPVAFDAERSFQCEICFANFADYAELDAHQTRYQKNNKQHRCGRCARSFFFLNSLRDHEKTHAS